jgi:RNA polymerase sigma factor (sigma-70 family)
VAPTTTYADLVAARAPALLRLAVMLTGSRPDAEDLLQTTLLHTQRHADRIATMAAPAAYLRRALVHEHLSGLRRLRSRVRTTPLEGHEVAADGAAGAGGAVGDVVGDVAGDVAGGVERRDAVWRLLASLPRRQRAVLVLRFYEDLPDREIAAVLGCGESTVRAHASRALESLRTHLSETEEVLP